MYHNTDFFKSLEYIYGGKVLLGNNVAYKITGIRIISMWMFDGVIRDL